MAQVLNNAWLIALKVDALDKYQAIPLFTESELAAFDYVKGLTQEK